MLKVNTFYHYSKIFFIGNIIAISYEKLLGYFWPQNIRYSFIFIK